LQQNQPKGRGLGGLVQDDDGIADLSKIQMLVWTAIAIAIFLVAVFHTVATIFDPSASPWPVVDPKLNPWPNLGLPDIDGSLMVLMGLAQGAYLGKKLTTLGQPRLTGTTTASATVNDEVTLTGTSLSDGTGGQIFFNRVLLPAVISRWTDNEITFRLNGPLPVAGLGDITVVIGGVSSNPIRFTLT
jgi:hypothetical protein